MSDNIYCYIYLLQTRESRRLNESIYKVGKTKQSDMRRLSQYPKGSMLLLYSECLDCDKTEKIILTMLRNKFIPHTEYGSEYFEGNYIEMKFEINKETNNNKIENQLEEDLNNNKCNINTKIENKFEDDIIVQKSSLEIGIKINEKKPRSQKQIDAFIKNSAIRQANVDRRKKEKQILDKENQQILENKIIAKAITLKKKQIKNEKMLQIIADDEKQSVVKRADSDSDINFDIDTDSDSEDDYISPKKENILNRKTLKDELDKENKDIIVQKSSLEIGIKIKEKKPRSQKQIESFIKTIAKRQVNRDSRKLARDLLAEQDKEILENKIIAKAILLKKKQIRNERCLSIIDDYEEEEPLKKQLKITKKPSEYKRSLEPIVKRKIKEKIIDEPESDYSDSDDDYIPPTKKSLFKFL